MKRVLIIKLKCLLLVSFLLSIGCGVESFNSTDLMKNETQKLSCKDNFDKAFIDELSDSILAQVEKETADKTLPISDSNETYTDAEILLSPKWLKRLGDDATYFINLNKGLNEQRVALLKINESKAENGVVMSSCRLDDDGRLDVTFTMHDGVTSNFPNLVESYNNAVTKRNASFEEKKISFQNDFEGTSYIIKLKKDAKEIKSDSLNRKADSDYLQNLYQSRIKNLLIFSRGKNEQ